MREKILIFFGLILTTMSAFGQQIIDVTDQTIRLGGNTEEELYYAFAEDDKIIFSFEEAGNKDLKEVEIVEYPNNSRFSDYKTKKIDSKTITVNKTGVYVFRFKNYAITGRICKIKIQRIPVSDATKNFNTTVTWVEKQDTTWNTYTRDIIIGYDTTYIQKTRKELLIVDTTITPLFDKTLRVHSETAIGKSQYTYANVELPKNTYFPNKINPYKSTEIICWSYWIGVGQKSAEEYEKTNKNLYAGINAIGALTGYGALATLATTGISLFGSTNVGENVRYKFYGIKKLSSILAMLSQLLVEMKR